MEEKTIYLFRHGKPAEELQGRCRGGETHCGLSLEGVAQTYANIRYLLNNHSPKEVKDFFVVTSGMERSDFFGSAMKEFGSTHIVEPKFRTIHAGEWEGLRWHTIKKLWPEQYALACEQAQYLEMPGGENVGCFRERVRKAFHDCLALPARHVVIVGHGCTNDVILAEAEHRETLHFRNQTIGCLNHIEMDDKQKLSVRKKNTIVYNDQLLPV